MTSCRYTYPSPLLLRALVAIAAMLCLASSSVAQTAENGSTAGMDDFCTNLCPDSANYCALNGIEKRCDYFVNMVCRCGLLLNEEDVEDEAKGDVADEEAELEKEGEAKELENGSTAGMDDFCANLCPDSVKYCARTGIEKRCDYFVNMVCRCGLEEEEGDEEKEEGGVPEETSAPTKESSPVKPTNAPVQVGSPTAEPIDTPTYLPTMATVEEPTSMPVAADDVDIEDPAAEIDDGGNDEPCQEESRILDECGVANGCEFVGCGGGRRLGDTGIDEDAFCSGLFDGFCCESSKCEACADELAAEATCVASSFGLSCEIIVPDDMSECDEDDESTTDAPTPTPDPAWSPTAVDATSAASLVGGFAAVAATVIVGIVMPFL